jgi:hypothetical protein
LSYLVAEGDHFRDDREAGKPGEFHSGGITGVGLVDRPWIHFGEPAVGDAEQVDAHVVGNFDDGPVVGPGVLRG